MAETKQKRKRIPRRQRPAMTPLQPGQFPTASVSMSQQRFIGRVVVAWSKLEMVLQELIWTLADLEMEDGRIFTERQDVTRLISMLRALAELHIPDEGEPNQRHRLLDVLDVVDQLKEERNRIVHGSWGILVSPNPNGLIDRVPMVISLRLPSINPSDVTSETYPPSMMHEIANRISDCLTFLNLFLLQIEAAPETTSEQPPEATPTPPPDHRRKAAQLHRPRPSK
jgi:hypothetical protein